MLDLLLLLPHHPENIFFLVRGSEFADLVPAADACRMFARSLLLAAAPPCLLVVQARLESPRWLPCGTFLLLWAMDRSLHALFLLVMSEKTVDKTWQDSRDATTAYFVLLRTGRGGRERGSSKFQRFRLVGSGSLLTKFNVSIFLKLEHYFL